MTSTTTPSDDRAPGRTRMLVLLAAAELLGMSVWFSANAVAPQLAARWHLSAGQAGALTTAVQLGFVAGTALAALFNLADLVPMRAYFALAALFAALANAALVVAPGYGVALATRFATGCALAGVYPPGMKMISTWYRRSRGLAIGTVVGALAAGKGLPYLLHAIGGAPLATVVLGASAAAALAAVLVGALYHDGPFPFPRRAFTWRLVATVVHHRATRLAIAGYLGHMWELYAMWTWVPAFLAASVALSGGAAAAHASSVPLMSFGVLAAGGAGCVWGGWWARRVGYARVVTVSMAVSAVCAIVIGLTFGASPWLVATAVWVWGFFVVSDSAQFSAMVTESAPPHAVGTALTLQTSLGFLLTMVTIQGVPPIVDAVGWRGAFPVLALGPVAGILAIARLGAGGDAQPSRSVSRNASP
ncbi:MAG TPA: MFS transporter [Candidatus Saccharimonadaceae bacterium]|nr:MFS transporter [Candidatus Saccharimonadaceae bacterium]